MSDVSDFITIINKLINVEFCNNAEANGIIVRKLVTIASYDETSNTATVYFQGDNKTESTPYQNKTGQSLKIGDKVILFHPYGSPANGWIMLKTSQDGSFINGLTYEVIKEVE